MAYLYHGSATAGIKTLEARSALHGTGERVVYLTDCPSYALLYIWDETITASPVKHVTAWMEGGSAQYEEQFPRQLERFYRGASGWLYRAPRGDARAVAGREGLYCRADDTPVEGTHIPDVYAALLRCEAEGTLKVRRFTEQTPQRQDELTALIAQWIIREDFFRADKIQRAFMERYFPRAWERARTAPPVISARIHQK